MNMAGDFSISHSGLAGCWAVMSRRNPRSLPPSYKYSVFYLALRFFTLDLLSAFLFLALSVFELFLGLALVFGLRLFFLSDVGLLL